MFLRKLFCCRPEPTFLSLQAYFFVAPSLLFCRPERSEGSPPGDVISNEEKRDAVPSEARDASLSLGRTKRALGRTK